MNNNAIHTQRLNLNALQRRHQQTAQTIAQLTFRLIQAEQQLAALVDEVSQLLQLTGEMNDEECFRGFLGGGGDVRSVFADVLATGNFGQLRRDR